MARGAVVSCKCVKAARGICPPLGNAKEEPGGALNTLFEAVALEPLADVVDIRLVFAAVIELDGPNNCAAVDPPETRPTEPPELPMPVRM